ncbi:hypothetical protein LXM94_07850 [Rhizobium sp. TRM95111]|uniref:hypothetical protein n=1 Tax=Rhizobium alarense TaxID=2846851 RepID=UPI001F3909B7|nr:hypothetical protein [Rhizobium alarense]MCF3639880.1 hypothetical protein [Rhizobium alarense]
MTEAAQGGPGAEGKGTAGRRLLAALRWTGEQLRGALSSNKLYLLVLALLVYYAVVNRTNIVNLVDDYTQFRTSGSIYVDSPEVYTRERLVNDRYEQAAWLQEQLKEVDRGEYLASSLTEGERRSFDLAVGAADGKVVAGADGKTAGAADGKAVVATTEKAATPDNKSRLGRMPFDQEHEIKAATRDRIRQSIIENMLDDRHDLIGNTLVALKFDTTVIPNRSVERRAFIDISLDTENIAFQYDDVLKSFPDRADPLFVACEQANEDRRLRWELVVYFCGKYHDALLKTDGNLGKIHKLFVNWLNNIENRLASGSGAGTCAATSSYRALDVLASRINQDLIRQVVLDRLGTTAVEIVETAAVDAAGNGVSHYRLALERPWSDIVEISALCKGGRMTYSVRSLSETFIVIDNDIRNVTACGEAVKPKECGYAGIYEAYMSDLEARFMQRHDGGDPSGTADPKPAPDDPAPLDAVFSLISDGIIIAKIDSQSGSHLILKKSEFVSGDPLTRNYLEQIRYSIGNDDWIRITELAGHITSQVQDDWQARKYTFIRYRAEGCQHLKHCLMYGFPSGFFNFISRVSRMDSFAYSLMPTNRSSATFATRSLAERMSFGMSGATLSGGKATAEEARDFLRESYASEIDVIGYGNGEVNPNRINFGWVMNVSAQAGGRQHSQMALLSIPAWLDELKLKVRKGWLNHDGSERETAEEREMIIPLPFDYEVLDSYVADDFRYRKPRIVGKPLKQTISATRGGSVVIPGDRLWRSTVVLLQGRKAKSIVVMPDMRGLIAEFDGPFPPGRLSLVVWTSEGMVPIDDMVYAADDGAAAVEPQAVVAK